MREVWCLCGPLSVEAQRQDVVQRGRQSTTRGQKRSSHDEEETTILPTGSWAQEMRLFSGRTRFCALRERTQEGVTEMSGEGAQLQGVMNMFAGRVTGEPDTPTL